MYRVKLTPTAGRMFNSLHPTVKKQHKSMLKELYKKPVSWKAVAGRTDRLQVIKNETLPSNISN